MEALRFDGERLILLDQRRLPLEERYVECRTYREVAEAIRNMTVRGAPAIGVAAAYGLALAAREAAVEPGTFWEKLDQAAEHLAATRPTAVNLFWAIRRMREVADTRRNDGVGAVVTALRAEAESIHREDIEMNRRIGAYGQELIGDGYRILTHCNAGALATGGYGTALGVIRAAVENGKKIHVYADETRPLLQGARLTAWELMNDGIPVTLITDSMAGQFMRRGKIDFVVVGADRIAANGDVANKIGTYNVAVLAKENGIPFYVAAPGSTIDLGMAAGDEIIIEERLPEEVITFAGVPIAPPGVQVANPAFDVTPHRYVTGIITDRGVVYPPYGVNLPRLFGDRP